MIDLNKYARPYARAAFDYAHTTGTIEAWSKHLAFLAAAVKNPLVLAMINHPAYSPKQRADVMIALCGDNPPDRFQQNFIRELARHRRLKTLTAIYVLFQEYADKLNQVIDAKVYSVVPLTKDLQQHLTQKLAERFHQNINLSTEIDASLLAGFLVKAGDVVVDYSLRGQLERMQNQLTD